MSGCQPFKAALNEPQRELRTVAKPQNEFHILNIGGRIFDQLMPKRSICATILFAIFKKQRNTDLFDLSVPKGHNSQCQNAPFPLQMKQVKVS